MHESNHMVRPQYAVDLGERRDDRRPPVVPLVEEVCERPTLDDEIGGVVMEGKRAVVGHRQMGNWVVCDPPHCLRQHRSRLVERVQAARQWREHVRQPPRSGAELDDVGTGDRVNPQNCRQKPTGVVFPCDQRRVVRSALAVDSRVVVLHTTAHDTTRSRGHSDPGSRASIGSVISAELT